MAEKLRVHTLAKEIGVESKAILSKCRAEGLDVKNHMTALTAGLAATIREWFSEGAHVTTMEKTERVNLKAVRVRPKPKASPPATETIALKERAPASAGGAGVESPPSSGPETAVAVAEAPAATPSVSESSLETPPEQAAPEIVRPELPQVAAEAPAAAPSPEPEPEAEVAPDPEAESVAPAGPQNVPAPAQLKGPRVIRVEKPDDFPRPAPKAPRPREAAPVEVPDLPVRPPGRRGQVATEQKEDQRSTAPGKTRAHPRRSPHGSEIEAGERIREWRERDLIERQERMKAASGRGLHARRAVSRPAGGPRSVVAPPKVKVSLNEPIVLRDFCAATGIGMARLMPKMIRDHKIVPSIGMTLSNELAAELAAEFEIEVVIEKAKSALDRLREEFEALERKNSKSRPPVVTFLGHVDHGKTSLLDAIRQSRVAEGESGGITQHIGAYRLDRDGLSVTFLDTPGHEAFTAMRARGAQMTDVVVLVVAANDGVMAQTIEAINHAKAADVAIVVALNKMDLPGLDTNRVLGQLVEQGLTPHDWGGDVDVIETSATTGKGVDDLLEHLNTLSELLELKGDPDLPATGIVIEATMKEGVGPSARVLVMDGTLHLGDTIVCGGGFGRVRTLLDDRGQRMREAGPATPVEVAGLSELPEAGDHFFHVSDLQRAKSVAEEVQLQRRQESLVATHKPRTLVDLLREREMGEVPELNVILRADVQGSVDVLRKTLNEITTERGKLTILHAAAGGITEGDVVLAQASDAIIIGFHVVADPAAERLAAEKGVDIRLYRVIYHLTDDVHKALEGMLTPERHEEFRGRAEVREVFRVSKVGLIAGCFVTDGIIARSHFARVIREGRIIVPTEEDVTRGRHRGIDSLKRFKDDAREVRNGMECGIRVRNFDDIKTGDLIESYEVIEVARKL